MPTNYADLTPRQQDALRVMVDHVERLGMPPTIVEASASMRLSNGMGSYAFLNALEAKGYVRRSPGAPCGLTVLKSLNGAMLPEAERRN